MRMHARTCTCTCIAPARLCAARYARALVADRGVTKSTCDLRCGWTAVNSFRFLLFSISSRVMIRDEEDALHCAAHLRLAYLRCAQFFTGIMDKNNCPLDSRWPYARIEVQLDFPGAVGVRNTQRFDDVTLSCLYQHLPCMTSVLACLACLFCSVLFTRVRGRHRLFLPDSHNTAHEACITMPSACPGSSCNWSQDEQAQLTLDLNDQRLDQTSLGTATYLANWRWPFAACSDICMQISTGVECPAWPRSELRSQLFTCIVHNTCTASR